VKLRSWLWLSTLAFVACGDDDDASEAIPPGPVCASFVVLRPRGNEEVWLPDQCAIQAANEDMAEAEAPPEPPPEDLKVVIGCDRKLGVDIVASNWTFRPPYACGGVPQCGYMLLELDPTLDPAPTECQEPIAVDAAPGSAGAPPDAAPGSAGAPAEPPPRTAASCSAVALQRGVLDLAPLGDALAGPHVLRATLINADRTRFRAPCTESGGSCFDSLVLPVTFEVEDCSSASDGGAGGTGG
jgi:hypothetical protein